jgi:hypothetical protein
MPARRRLAAYSRCSLTVIVAKRQSSWNTTLLLSARRDLHESKRHEKKRERVTINQNEIRHTNKNTSTKHRTNNITIHNTDRKT